MTKDEYALLWANGASFGDVYDLMKADLEAELLESWSDLAEAANEDED